MSDKGAQPDDRWANIAAILILAGAVLLIGELFDIRLGSSLWPAFILVPGLVFLILAFRGSEANSGFAVPGGVLTTLGLIFFYQIWTDHWESWAYIWALIPVGVAAALYGVGIRNSDETSLLTARRTARFFGIFFIAGAVFFELLIFDRGGFSGYFLPIALVVVGGVMLWLHYNRTGSLPWIDRLTGSSSVSSASSPGSGAAPSTSASAAPTTTASPAPPAPRRSAASPSTASAPATQAAAPTDPASPPPASATPPATAAAQPKQTASARRSSGSTSKSAGSRSTRSRSGSASKSGTATKASGSRAKSGSGSTAKATGSGSTRRKSAGSSGSRSSGAARSTARSSRSTAAKPFPEGESPTEPAPSGSDFPADTEATSPSGGTGSAVGTSPTPGATDAGNGADDAGSAPSEDNTRRPANNPGSGSTRAGGEDNS